MVMLFVSPTLPLPEGDRIVHLRNWDVQANETEPRALHDFVVWRQAMRSVTDFGAWEDVARNLRGRDGEARPVLIAAITASGFRVAATPPLLGRALVPAGRAGRRAAGGGPRPRGVADALRGRLRGRRADRAARGRVRHRGGRDAGRLRVPGLARRVDAVPPDVLDDAPRRGPGITIFGRLAPGATLDDARPSSRSSAGARPGSCRTRTSTCSPR
jgi:hypothetical protein